MNAKEETVMDNKLGCKCCDNCQCWKKGPCPCDKKEDSNCKCCSNCACKNNDKQSGCCCGGNK